MAPIWNNVFFNCFCRLELVSQQDDVNGFVKQHDNLLDVAHIRVTAVFLVCIAVLAFSPHVLHAFYWPHPLTPSHTPATHTHSPSTPTDGAVPPAPSKHGSNWGGMYLGGGWGGWCPLSLQKASPHLLFARQPSNPPPLKGRVSLPITVIPMNTDFPSCGTKESVAMRKPARYDREKLIGGCMYRSL